MRHMAFIVTKPLQILVALSIIKQLGIRDETHLIIVDNFFNAHSVYEGVKSTDWEFTGLAVEFCKSYNDAYKLICAIGVENLFIDSDVGVVKYIDLLKLKFKSSNLNVNVYEEGLGTYRADLYSGIKKLIFNLFGIGTQFGGCKLTDCLYLYDPEIYQAKFPKYGKRLEKIGFSLINTVRSNFASLSHIFDYSPVAECRGDCCYVYLSSWQVGQKFLEKFSTLPGDKYLKFHPHIQTIEEFDCGVLVSRTAPAEMVLIDLMDKYKSVTVFHHGSSVERYVAGANLSFTKV